MCISVCPLTHTHTPMPTQPLVNFYLNVQNWLHYFSAFSPHNAMSFTEFMVTSKKPENALMLYPVNNEPVSFSQIKVKELHHKSELTFCRQLFSYFEL